MVTLKKINRTFEVTWHSENGPIVRWLPTLDSAMSWIKDVMS